MTGGAGFIGSNFIRYWLGRHSGDRILCFDAMTYAGDERSLADVASAHPSRYRFMRGDIASRENVAAAFAAADPEVIVNFAAESHNSRGVLEPGRFIHTNVVGTQVLLDAARSAPALARFHHISTCEVYGDLALNDPGSFREDSPYRPRTPYNASKAAADHLVRAYGNTFGLPVSISICCNNYGPYQHPEKVIPLFATNALEGSALPLYRQSENRREWLHVEDHCRGVEQVILHGRIGETYNIGSGAERSVEQIADSVLAIVKAPASLKTFVPDRPGHDRRYLLDHCKIERELGWRPAIAFEDGLRTTVEWYRKNADWWRPKKAPMAGEADEFGWSREPVRQ